MTFPRRPWLLSAPGLVLYAVFLVTPLAMTFLLSFQAFSITTGIRPEFGLGNYAEVLGDDYFHQIFLRTFGQALLVTLISAAIGAPEAYILHRMRQPWRGLFLLAVMGPLLVSVVARTLGWALLLGRNGIVAGALAGLGLPAREAVFLNTTTGVVVALVHVLVPFMVVSVWAALRRIDPATESAGESLGASRAVVLWRIVLPQVMPGVLSGSLIVFTLAASAFATPAIIGGRRLKVVATAAYDEFLNSQNWPLGAAIAALLMAATLVIVLAYNRLVERRFAEVFRPAEAA